LSPDVDRLVERVIGCGISVHRELGPGFFERVYHHAYCIELTAAGIPFQSEVPVLVTYRGQPLCEHRIDLIVDEKVIVELKAVERLDRIHQAQLVAYLKATRLHVGLLMNFNAEYLKAGLKRVVA
jgi:GxxExxY protein